MIFIYYLSQIYIFHVVNHKLNEMKLNLTVKFFYINLTINLIMTPIIILINYDKSTKRISHTFFI